MIGGNPGDDLVPVSIRLGEVVPPEDPEDWTRPLTWVAALGMLAGPMIALAWFVTAPPTDAGGALLATYLVAGTLSAGAAATGATQVGAARAATATLGAGLFGALLIIVLGVVMAGERQVGAASPTLAHAFAAAVSGLIGTAVAAIAGAVVAGLDSRIVRLLPALLAGTFLAMAGVSLLLGPPGDRQIPRSSGERGLDSGRSVGIPSSLIAPTLEPSKNVRHTLTS